MIITIKNLQQQTFTVNWEPEKTVLELKQFIFKERGADYAVVNQKLIYAGVILDDTKTVGSYNIDEKKFVVVMTKRMPDAGLSKKEEPATKTEQASSSSTTTPTEDTKVAKEPTTSTTSSTTTTTTSTETSASVDETRAGRSISEIFPSTTNGPRESILVMGDDYDDVVQNIVEMGYTRELVEQALAASYNNPERAVEYLISGIPSDAFVQTAGGAQNPLEQGSGFTGGVPDDDQDMDQFVAGSMNRPSNNPLGSEVPGGVGGDLSNAEHPLDFLRSQPQFQQMRNLLETNPELLSTILQQIGQTNPRLLRLISENQESFLSMLNEPQDGGAAGTLTMTTEHASQTDSSAADFTAANSGDSLRQRGVNSIDSSTDRAQTTGGGDGTASTSITISAQDKEAIERLKALGFPEHLVLQAYFAFEKNENSAANFLLSSYDD